MENVGGIQFDVIADTGQLIKAQQETEAKVAQMTKSMRGLGASKTQVDQVSKSVEDLGKSAQKSGFEMTKLQKAMIGAFTVGGALSIGKLADDYRTLTERVRFAVNSQEEYEIVQKRLIQSANESYRSLEEASEVFIGTSDNLRSLGFSLNDALDIADSLSFSFVKNATTTDRARNAINAYDNALNRGIVSTLDWRTINNAIPTLAQDIAKNLDISSDAVLRMGNAGELTASLLNETLLETFESNREAATGMATSIEDAFVKLRTNLQVFVGEANKTAGATDLIAASIDLVAENINTLATMMISVGAGAAAKYLTSFGLVTVAKMKDVVATRANIAAELELARVNLANTQAEVARTAALVAKGGAIHKNTQALNAQAIAVANLDRAQKAMAASSRSVMALLGGPAGIVGLIATAATAFVMFSEKTRDSSEAMEELKQPLDQIIARFEKLNAEQKALALIEYNDARVQMMKQEAQAADDIYSYLVRMNTARYKANQSDAIAISTMHEYRDAIKSAISEGGDIIQVIEGIARATGMSEADTRRFIETSAEYTKTRDAVLEAGKALDVLSESANKAADSIDGLTEAQRRQATINEEAGTELDKLAKSFRDSANSAKDNGSAVARAKREIEALEASGAQLDETKKKEIMTDAEYIDSKKRITKETNNNIQVLKDLEQELRLANLSGKELAITQAESRLTEFATEQEVQSVRNLAAAIYDLNQAKKFGQTDQEIITTITGEVNPLSGGAFDDQVARYEAEAELERERYADQLERLREAREYQLLTNEEFNDLEYDLQQRHDARMSQIQKAATSVQLQSYSNAFGSIADVLKNAQQEQSGIYKGMFAVAKAFSVSSATVAAYDAISKAWASAPFPENLGAVAMTTPQVMGVVSAIQGTNYGGGRQYGGPVSAGSAYRINETGESEVFDAGGGKQYFIPNASGNIIPANKVNYGNGQGGAPNVTINLIEDASRGGQVDQSFDDTNSYIDIFVANIRDGGEASQILEGTYGMKRVGN